MGIDYGHINLRKTEERKPGAAEWSLYALKDWQTTKRGCIMGTYYGHKKKPETKGRRPVNERILRDRIKI